MKGKWFTAALLAAAGVLGWSGASRGGDTIRLNGTASVPAQNLVDDGRGADTVRIWHHGFGWGGYRGFGWGGRGFGWGGYRGYGWGGLGYRGLGWGGLYRPYYGFGLGYGGLYRPYYGLGLGYGRLGYGLGRGVLGYGLGFGGYGLGYGGYGLGYGLGYGGFYPGFGLGYGGFFPCAGTSAAVYTLNIPAATLGTPLPAQPPATDLVPQMPKSDGTFPYDGGPSNPVPNLKETPPSSTTPRSLPLEGRSVSLPKAAPKWSYPAYGETARRIAPASERTYLTRGEVKKASPR